MRLAVLIAAATLAVFAPTTVTAQDVQIALAPGEVLLKVEAEGQHLSRPDVVTMSAGVVTTGPTAREALAANAALGSKVLDTIRTSGIAPRDVRTSQLTVIPQYQREPNGSRFEDDNVRRISGYLARNRLELKLRDLSKAPAIINAMFEAGANEVRGPSFSLSDPAPALRAARRAAVVEARSEAETYAEALGMRITRVLRVSERQAFEREDDAYITVTGSSVGAPPLEPGELKTRVQVWIDYAMVPR